MYWVPTNHCSFSTFQYMKSFNRDGNLYKKARHYKASRFNN